MSHCFEPGRTLWLKALEGYKVERAVPNCLDLQRREETGDEIREWFLEEDRRERVAWRSGQPMADKTTLERLVGKGLQIREPQT